MTAIQAEPRYLTRTLNEEDARQICSWRYVPPYDFYNVDESSLGELLDSAHHCIAVDDQSQRFVGFFTFGANARVSGATRAGLYAEPALDIGLGMRPDFTGQGRGLSFVRSGLGYGVSQFQPERFRLVVAAFNARAIRVYERAGFSRGATFTSPVRKVEVPFLILTRPASLPERPAGDA